MSSLLFWLGFVLVVAIALVVVTIVDRMTR